MKTYTITLKKNSQDALTVVYQLDSDAVFETTEIENVVTVTTTAELDVLLDQNDDVVSYSY